MNQFFAPKLMFFGEFGVTHEIGEGIAKSGFDIFRPLEWRESGYLADLTYDET
jgi:hypothetical protein